MCMCVCVILFLDRMGGDGWLCASCFSVSRWRSEDLCLEEGGEVVHEGVDKKLGQNLTWVEEEDLCSRTWQDSESAAEEWKGSALTCEGGRWELCEEGAGEVVPTSTAEDAGAFPSGALQCSQFVAEEAAGAESVCEEARLEHCKVSAGDVDCVVDPYSKETLLDGIDKLLSEISFLETGDLYAKKNDDVTAKLLKRDLRKGIQVQKKRAAQSELDNFSNKAFMEHIIAKRTSLKRRQLNKLLFTLAKLQVSDANPAA